MKYSGLIKYLAALAILTLASMLLIDQVIMPLYVRSGNVVWLPSVVGLPYEEAVKVLENEGFRAEKAGITHTQEYPPDQVFEMYPAPYSRVKKGRIIQLTVTEEEVMVSVPDLIGMTLRSAEIELARAGLEVDTTMHFYSDEYEAGVVTWQAPRGGNLLRRGSGISLMVSLGEPPPTYYVPSVVGMGFQAGRREILDAGLDLGQVKYIYAPNLLPNTILDQSIPGGTVLKVRRAITLTVSTYDKDLE
jgi:beta-lactam-binding protein with PASTA domain